MDVSGPVEVIGVVASVAFVLIAAGLSLWRGVGVERSVVWAAVRAAAQLLAVGLLLAAVFTAELAIWWAWLWVIAMVIIAALTARRRAPDVPNLAAAVALGIGTSTAVTIAIAFGLQIFTLEPVTLVVIAGITIGNTMPTTVLAADQTRRQLTTRVGEMEAKLALGLNGSAVTGDQTRDAARSSLIPQIERTKVVGLIALPGAMTGLLLAGVDPVDAVLVQLVVMYVVLGSVVVAATTVILVMSTRALTADLRVADWVRAADRRSED